MALILGGSLLGALLTVLGVLDSLGREQLWIWPTCALIGCLGGFLLRQQEQRQASAELLTMLQALEAGTVPSGRLLLRQDDFGRLARAVEQAVKGLNRQLEEGVSQLAAADFEQHNTGLFQKALRHAHQEFHSLQFARRQATAEPLAKCSTLRVIAKAVQAGTLKQQGLARELSLAIESIRQQREVHHQQLLAVEASLARALQRQPGSGLAEPGGGTARDARLVELAGRLQHAAQDAMVEAVRIGPGGHALRRLAGTFERLAAELGGLVSPRRAADLTLTSRPAVLPELEPLLAGLRGLRTELRNDKATEADLTSSARRLDAMLRHGGGLGEQLLVAVDAVDEALRTAEQGGAGGPYAAVTDMPTHVPDENLAAADRSRFRRDNPARTIPDKGCGEPKPVPKSSDGQIVDLAQHRRIVSRISEGD